MAATSLDSILSETLTRRRSKNQLRQLTTVPPGTADFSSNDYLSLSSHPVIQRAFLDRLYIQHTKGANPKETASTGPRPPSNLLGSGGSRLLDGNSTTAEALEQTIATFHHAPAGLLFNSAMDANIGLLSCVPQAGDVIVYDELIHASVHDGMRLSRAGKRIPFAHNRVYDTLNGKGQDPNRNNKYNSLEKVLLALQEEEGEKTQQSANGPPRQIFIVVEGIYSMDGDVAPLVDIVECLKRRFPGNNTHIIVDEAHSVGVVGDRGRGLVSYLGLEDRVWARVLGFGKAMGCAGGIVLCSPTTRSYLINYARPLIYTTMMPFPSLVGIETTYNFVTSGQAGPLLNSLRRLIQHTHKRLQGLYDRLPQNTDLLRLHSIAPTRTGLYHIQVDKVLTPVIPVLTSRPRSLASYCQQNKLMVRPIVAPTVPKGQERIRICLHAANTVVEVGALIHTMEEWVLRQLAQGNGEGSETQDENAKL